MKSASLPSSSEATRPSPNPTDSADTARLPAPIAILGVPLESVPPTAALDRIEAAIRRGQPYLAVTVNLSLFAASRRCAELRQLLAENDLGLSESRVVSAAACIAGRRFDERVDGADLRRSLLRRAANRGYRVFLLGAGAGDVTALQQEYPELQIVGFDSEIDCAHQPGALLRRVRDARAQLMIVGACRTVYAKWLSANRRKISVPVCVFGFIGPNSSSGATDFAARSSAVRPWRQQLTRVAHCARQTLVRLRAAWEFTATFAREAQRWSRGTTEPMPGPVVTSAATDWLHIDVGGDLTIGALETHAEVWRLFSHHATNWALDLSHVERIDGSGIAFLLRGSSALRAGDRELVLIGTPPVVQSALQRAEVAHLLSFADSEQAAHQAVAAQRAPPPLERARLRTLAWCGEIVAANTEDVRQMSVEYIRTFAATGTSLVLIDLERLRFIDTAGAALMLQVKQWAREVRVEVMYAHAQANVRHMLQLTHTDRLLLEGGQ